MGAFKAYVDQYTNLKVVDPATGGTVEVHITGYGSGWEDNVAVMKDYEEKKAKDPDTPRPKPAGNRGQTGPRCQTEFALLRTALAKLLQPDAKQPILTAKIMTEKSEDLKKAFPGKVISVAGLTRAFLGKGSPTEMSDALTIAKSTGRIGDGKDVAGQTCAARTFQDYADKFMTLDCNGLVGNATGVNPEFSPGWFADAKRVRKKIEDVQAGDIIVTVNASGNHEHVAALDEFVRPPTTEKEPSCAIRIAEWGQAGDVAKHYSPDWKMVKIEKGEKYGLGFKSDGGKFRYFFAPPPDMAAPRVRGVDGDATK